MRRARASRRFAPVLDALPTRIAPCCMMVGYPDTTDPVSSNIIAAGSSVPLSSDGSPIAPGSCSPTASDPSTVLL